MFDYFIKTAPQFLLYFGVTIALTVAFLVAYSAATPHSEFQLIRGGNSAAAISLMGALLGFVIPLGVVVQHSVDPYDVVLWGLVVLAVQILAFYAARMSLKNISDKITMNETSAGIYAGGIALAVGLLNASCMVP